MRGKRDIGIRSGYPAAAIIAGEYRNLPVFFTFTLVRAQAIADKIPLQEPILTWKLTSRLSVEEMLRRYWRN